MTEFYMIYQMGVVCSLVIYAVFAIVILAKRAVIGINKFANSGYIDLLENSWKVYGFDRGNHPVGLAIDTVIYTFLAIVAALTWMFTIIPAVISMIAVFKRGQYLKEKERQQIMDRLARESQTTDS